MSWHVLEQVLFGDRSPAPGGPHSGDTIDLVAAVELGEVRSLARDVSDGARATALVEAAPA